MASRVAPYAISSETGTITTRACRFDETGDTSIGRRSSHGSATSSTAQFGLVKIGQPIEGVDPNNRKVSLGHLRMDMAEGRWRMNVVRIRSRRAGGTSSSTRSPT